MTSEWPIEVRRLIDVTVETPSSGRRTNTTATGKPPCIRTRQASCSDFLRYTAEDGKESSRVQC